MTHRGSRAYAIGLRAGAIPTAVVALYAAGCTAGFGFLIAEADRDARR